MNMRKLGRSDLSVSPLCLGSMTWGSQNSEAEAHAQIDMALDHGVNFIDSAEMYPTTPHHRDTCGDSERRIGEWVAKTGRRADVVLATKVVGDGYENIREGGPITPDIIRTACEDSLRKLQTDYIDLYQIHWPNRGSYHFIKHWEYDPSTQDTARALEDIEAELTTLDALVKEGKIRHIGLSNETAWGTMQYLRIAERLGLPRVATVQNEYSFLRRFYDLDMAELSHHENVGLICYTPLGGGMLTGKYSDGAMPEGSRAAINEGIGGRMTEFGMAAADAYVAVARKHGLDPAQMALAWCMARPFMASVIFGATSLPQLETSLAAMSLTLDEEVLSDILDVYKRYPKPH